MSDANKRVITAFLKALGAGNGEELRQLLDRDVQAIAMGTSAMSKARGFDEIVGTAGLLDQMIPKGIDFEIISMTSEADRVAVEASGRSVLANGVPYNNHYAFIATIRDDKIVLLKEYFCTKLVEETLVPLVSAMT
jgi:uncharacterized protein